jgi:hypothetical protein
MSATIKVTMMNSLVPMNGEEDRELRHRARGYHPPEETPTSGGLPVKPDTRERKRRA